MKNLKVGDLVRFRFELDPDFDDIELWRESFQPGTIIEIKEDYYLIETEDRERYWIEDCLVETRKDL